MSNNPPECGIQNPDLDSLRRNVQTENNALSFTVLIVEDNPVQREVARRLVSRLDVACVVACNGQEALDILEKQSIGVIFMDCQMPILDGLTATQRIRAAEKVSGKHIIIIGCTACSDRDTCLAAGMDDYIEKPLTPKVLEAKMRGWLSGPALRQ